MKLLRSNFLRNTGLLFSGSFLAQVLGLVVTPLLSRIYSPEDFGALGLFNSIVAVVMVIAGFRYEMAIIVEDDRQKALNLTQLALGLNLLISGLILLALFLFDQIIVDALKITDPRWLYLTPLAVALGSMSESLVMWHNRAKKYGKLAGNKILKASSSAAYKLSHPLIFSAGNGLVIGQLVGQISAFTHLFLKHSAELIKVDFKELRQASRDYKHFPIFSMPAALVNMLAVYMPFFVLSYFGGQEYPGYLENASKLTYLPMSMLAVAFSQVFFERIARIKDDKEMSAAVSHQLIQFLFFLSVIPVAILVVYGDKIIPAVLGSEWQLSGQFVQILILFYFSMYLTSPFSSAFEAYNKLRVHFIYNSIFLLTTTAALFITYKVYNDMLLALQAYAFTGTVLRLLILNYFFKLFGRSLIIKTFLGILIVAVLIWLLTLTR